MSGLRQGDQSPICDEVRKMLEDEVAELERKLQLYQLLLAMIESQCSSGQRREKAVVIEYEAGDGSTAARIIVAEGTVKASFIKPLDRGSPYTKYLLKVLRQLEEESPDVTVSEEVIGDHVRGVTAQKLSRDQVEDLLLALDYVLRRLGFRRRERRV